MEQQIAKNPVVRDLLIAGLVLSGISACGYRPLLSSSPTQEMVFVPSVENRTAHDQVGPELTRSIRQGLRARGVIVDGSNRGGAWTVRLSVLSIRKRAGMLALENQRVIPGTEEWTLVARFQLDDAQQIPIVGPKELTVQADAPVRGTVVDSHLLSERARSRLISELARQVIDCITELAYDP